MTQGDLFTQANTLADSGVPKEHVDRILANIANITGPRDKPLPFKRIVSTRKCPRRADVIVADLIMFDDKAAELEVFETGKVDGKIVSGGFWSYVPEGFPLFRDGVWRRGDPRDFGVTYGIVHHELDGAEADNCFSIGPVSASEIAADLASTVPEFAFGGREPEDLLPHVESWLKSRRKATRPPAP